MNFNLKNQEQSTQEIAYYLWLNAGQPHGRDLEFWLQAQNQNEYQNQNSFSDNELIIINNSLDNEFLATLSEEDANNLKKQAENIINRVYYHFPECNDEPIECPHCSCCNNDEPDDLLDITDF